MPHCWFPANVGINNDSRALVNVNSAPCMRPNLINWFVISLERAIHMIITLVRIERHVVQMTPRLDRYAADHSEVPLRQREF